MKVYRVEKPETLMGPYWKQFTSLGDQMSWSHSASVRAHPCPDLAFPRMPHAGQQWKCGFDSTEALIRWFDGWLPRLFENGYRIVALDVTDDDMVATGCKYESGQVLFRDERDQASNKETDAWELSRA